MRNFLFIYYFFIINKGIPQNPSLYINQILFLWGEFVFNNPNFLYLYIFSFLFTLLLYVIFLKKSIIFAYFL